MGAAQLKMDLVGDGPRDVVIDDLVIAGWTGRDTDAMEAHIAELQELGVQRPPRTPMYYRVAASLLTTAPEIQVIAGQTSGEVEAIVFAQEEGLWIGVASDHTDREAEAVDVALSKQLCAKPVAPTLWRFDEVKDHWDDLQLTARAIDGASEVVYQEGKVSTMQRPEALIERYGGLKPGMAMFCGTLAVNGGLRPSEAFAIRLHDPVLSRSIEHRYGTRVLPRDE